MTNSTSLASPFVFDLRQRVTLASHAENPFDDATPLCVVERTSRQVFDQDRNRCDVETTYGVAPVGRDLESVDVHSFQAFDLQAVSPEETSPRQLYTPTGTTDLLQLGGTARNMIQEGVSISGVARACEVSHTLVGRCLELATLHKPLQQDILSGAVPVSELERDLDTVAWLGSAAMQKWLEWCCEEFSHITAPNAPGYREDDHLEARAALVTMLWLRGYLRSPVVDHSPPDETLLSLAVAILRDRGPNTGEN